MKALTTERLLLEPLSEDRREAFVALCADPDAMRYWGTGGPWSREEAERNFAASLTYWGVRGFGKRSIVSKETGSWLGFADTCYVGKGCDGVSPDEVEIGWMLTPPAWGRGYATEAARAVRDEAFERVKRESIIAMYHPENGASARIVQKLGLVYERDATGWDGESLRVHRLTREGWKRLHLER